MPLRQIKPARDIAVFLEQSNCLHDADLLSAQFENSGIGTGNPRFIDDRKTVLRLRYVVTSIRDTVIELVFEGIREWTLRHPPYAEVVDTALSFTDDGRIIWADDLSTAPEYRRDCSFVIAEKMLWRIV